MHRHPGVSARTVWAPARASLDVRPPDLNGDGWWVEGGEGTRHVTGPRLTGGTPGSAPVRRVCAVTLLGRPLLSGAGTGRSQGGCSHALSGRPSPATAVPVTGRHPRHGGTPRRPAVASTSSSSATATGSPSRSGRTATGPRGRPGGAWTSVRPSARPPKVFTRTQSVLQKRVGLAPRVTSPPLRNLSTPGRRSGATDFGGGPRRVVPVLRDLPEVAPSPRTSGVPARTLVPSGSDRSRSQSLVGPGGPGTPTVCACGVLLRPSHYWTDPGVMKR